MFVTYVKNIIEELFQEGLKKGDIFWFVDKTVKNATKNCLYFGISLVLIIFCCIEIGCQLYMVTQKPTVSQFFTFGPMFFTSFHVLCSVCPVVFQRYHYKKIYRVYMNLWPLKVADQQGLKEIKYLFIKGSCSVIFYTLMASIVSIAYLPLRGLDFDRSIWPAIAALKLLKDGPQSLIYAVIFMNYGLVFAKAYYLAIYGMHLMHMCTLYAIQNILLRRRIDCINNDNEDISPLVLIDDRKYQERVKRELKECIKLDIKLKRFSTSLIDYFKWVMIMHVGNAIIILSMLYYVNLFMNGGYDPLSTRCYVLAANLMAVCYAHYSEIYFEQALEIISGFSSLWTHFLSSKNSS